MLCDISHLMFFEMGKLLQKDPYPVSLKLMLANEKYAQP